MNLKQEFMPTIQQGSLVAPADDSVFYDNPRFVYHIDDGAVKALTE
jgi:hypothetical protein